MALYIYIFFYIYFFYLKSFFVIIVFHYSLPYFIQFNLLGGVPAEIFQMMLTKWILSGRLIAWNLGVLLPIQLNCATNWLQNYIQVQSGHNHNIYLANTISHQKGFFSKHRPSGPMLSISRNIRLSVCLSVRLCVFSLLRYRLNVFLPPLPKVEFPIFLEIRNPWGKVMERSCLRFENYCLKIVKNAPRNFFFC